MVEFLSRNSQRGTGSPGQIALAGRTNIRTALVRMVPTRLVVNGPASLANYHGFAQENARLTIRTGRPSFPVSGRPRGGMIKTQGANPLKVGKDKKQNHQD
jgi:hypothetical protein